MLKMEAVGSPAVRSHMPDGTVSNPQHHNHGRQQGRGKSQVYPLDFWNKPKIKKEKENVPNIRIKIKINFYEHYF
jgi:hypothetical protein